MPSQPHKTQSDALTRQLLHRGRSYDPFNHAEMLGLQVIFKDITRDELVLPRKYATIVVCNSLRDVHQRNALAHGIAHWELGHQDDRPKHEHQADRYAALYLIHPMELAEVCRWTDDLSTIAQELLVTRRLLGAYLSA